MQENIDYLLFLVISAVAFFALWVFLPRLRKGAVFPPAILAVAALFAVANWWAVEKSGAEAQANIEGVIRSLAPTYASELETLAHERITPDTPADDPGYLQIIKRIQRWERVSTFAHDIYTVRRLPDGKTVFIVDPESDYNRDGKFDKENEKRTPIGQVVEEADSGLELALQGKANFSRDVVRDQWGEWVGAWAPVHGKDGKVEAVVGVDFAAQQWVEAVNRARSGAILRGGMIMLLLAVGGAAFGMLRAKERQRQQAEDRRRHAESRMAVTLQRMPLAFVEFDLDGKCLTWNPMAERIFGYSAKEVLGREVRSMLLDPSEHESARRSWNSLLAQTGGTHMVSEHLTRGGEVLVCEWFNTPLTDARGEVIGVLSLAQDITERVNLEKHFQHAQRLNAVGQLAAGVAHDFNNILTIITGHAGLVLDHPALPKEMRQDLERIEDAAVRASGLTRQLLAFSRQQAMFPRPLHLGRIVENSAALLERVLGDAVAFSAHIEPDLPAIEADAAMLDQVITNLVLNARDAMPRGGKIELQVKRAVIDESCLRQHPEALPGECVCLSVTDTGTGIAPEHLIRMFEPFFTTKETGKGTGLGLSVVHGIVKQHRGWIDVTSEVGRGSSFRLYFPSTSKMPAEDLAAVRPERGESAARRKTILLAEDEGIVRDLARMILERAGYRVLDAADGVEALRLWTQHRDDVDLLLTDMMMPNGVTGRDLSLKLLADEPDLAIVYASGYSLELTAPDFCETERQMFLPKPYLTDQLLATVEQCLGNEPQRNRELTAV